MAPPPIRSPRLRTRIVRAGWWSLALLVPLALAPVAGAQKPEHIRSGGPLTDITVGATLGCQVRVNGTGMYWPPDDEPAACGTFLAVEGGDLWGPTGALREVRRQPLKNGPQSPVTGQGTAADPYRVVTEARLRPNAGSAAGALIRETVTYVTGDDFYRGDITVINETPVALGFRLYHAADCHLPSGGFFGVGYGFQRDAGDGRTTVGCAEHPDNDPPGEAQSLVPITTSNGYMEGYYATMWGKLDATVALSNTVAADQVWDAAMALSWRDTLPPVGPGNSATYSYLAWFSMPPGPPVQPPDPGTGTATDPDVDPPSASGGPVPETPATVSVEGTVVAERGAPSVGVRARCIAPRGRCVVEVGTRRARRTVVVSHRRVARLRALLERAQRRELRRDCATALTLRAVVYQPGGRAPRSVRRIVRVLCAGLPAPCLPAARSMFAAGPLASPLGELRRRRSPRLC